MSYDLALGFKKKPEELDKILSEQGFIFTSEVKDTLSKIPIREYSDNISRVYLTYHDGIYPDSAREWKRHYGINIVAEATISISTNNDLGELKQLKIGKFLRDHYDASLENPQEVRLITD